MENNINRHSRPGIRTTEIGGENFVDGDIEKNSVEIIRVQSRSTESAEAVEFIPAIRRRWDGPVSNKQAERDIFVKECPWGLPKDIVEKVRRGPFSGRFTPHFAQLIEDIAIDLDLSQELVGTAALSSTAIVAQGLYDIQSPGRKPSPIGFYTLTVAESGKGKTDAITELTRPIVEYQEQENLGTAAIHESAAELRTWELRVKGCERLLVRHFNDEEKCADLQAQLETLLKNKPAQAKSARNILIQSGTWSAIEKDLQDHSPIIGWVNEEASMLFQKLKLLMPHLNSLYSGVSVNDNTVTSGLAYQAHPRCTIAWYTQEYKLRKYLKDNGEEFVKSGLGARALIAVCQSSKSPHEDRRYEISRVTRDTYHKRLRLLLRRYDAMLKSGKIERSVLRYSKEAEALRAQTQKWIKYSCDDGGSLHGMREFSRRCCENIDRIAAVLHVGEDYQEKEISLETLCKAILIMDYYAEQHAALFCGLDLPQDERDAKCVEDTIGYHYRTSNRQLVYFSVRWLVQHARGGRELRRDRKRINAALDFLADRGIVRFDPNKKDTVWINCYHFEQFSQDPAAALFGW